MILDSKKERIRELEAELAVVTEERDNAIHNLDEFLDDLEAARKELVAAVKERDRLRLQLRNISEALEKLREAVHPLRITTVRGTSLPSVSDLASLVNVPHEKGVERC